MHPSARTLPRALVVFGGTGFVGTAVLAAALYLTVAPALDPDHTTAASRNSLICRRVESVGRPLDDLGRVSNADPAAMRESHPAPSIGGR